MSTNTTLGKMSKYNSESGEVVREVLKELRSNVDLEGIELQDRLPEVVRSLRKVTHDT